MNKKKYTLEYHEFKKMYSLIENIDYSISIIKSFCDNKKDSADLSQIKPIMNYISKETDLLHAEFINRY